LGYWKKNPSKREFDSAEEDEVNREEKYFQDDSKRG
jgi:hypothetical protein